MSDTISPEKLEANRRNAALSTGPRTPEGKGVSRFNRLRHGLASPLTVLPWEDQSEYNNLYASFREEYTPCGPTEEALVKEITDAQWKLRRLEKLEQHVFTAMLAQSQTASPNEPNCPRDPFEIIAASLLTPGRNQSALSLLARYQATLNRQFHNGLRALKKVQDERLRQDFKDAKRELVHGVLERDINPRTDDDRGLLDLLAHDPGLFTRYLRAEAELARAIYKTNHSCAIDQEAA